ncbi:MAG: hypothetical protein HYV07_23210 [Deltaproteobacteria bacterium]|nr:hypothetical protein [Deltaproteobacteria bacterium]
MVRRSVVLVALIACREEPGVVPSLDASAHPDAAALDAPAPRDAPPSVDASPAEDDAGVSGDATADAGPVVCPPAEEYDFTCGGPESCPGGACVLGLCIGARIGTERWDDCGDGVCDRCEAECPADCAPPLTSTGTMAYEGDRTITVWVHGFSNKSPEDLEQKVYGADRGCPEILELAGDLVPPAPCGDTLAGSTSPTQWSSVEYYGGVPETWMTPDDVREIERYPWDGTTTLHRYALIVAKFIRHKLDVSGARHVNVACHSMGCLITRYLVENNILGLGSERLIVRWFTTSGVLGGARLAYLYTNPAIQNAAGAIGLELSDFAVMNPDFVAQNAARWDHRLHELNHPYFGGMLIHNLGGSDPMIREALGIRLLDLGNPEDEPNDGIMYTFDELVWSQSEDASVRVPSGALVSATHSLVHEYHMKVPDTDAAVVMAAAALFHRRKVFITLEELELRTDGESHRAFDGQRGEAPAELALESRVEFPYAELVLGRPVIVHEDRVEFRTAEVMTLSEGSTIQPGLSVFQGPVLDGMDIVRVDAKLEEVDWYPRFGVRESVIDQSQTLGQLQAELPLVDGDHDVDTAALRARFRVRVVEMY